jgi:hypothetical protein
MSRRPFVACVLLFVLFRVQSSAELVTYNFSGSLTDPYGSLPVGTPFTGSFSYEGSQPLSTPALAYRGDYDLTTITVTLGSTTIVRNGPNIINVYNHDSLAQDPGYATDLFHLYNTGSEIQIVLQDVEGAVFASPAIPGAGLSMNDFTSGPGTFFQIEQSRGSIDSLSSVTGPAAVPEPAEFVLVSGAGLSLFAVFRRFVQRQRVHTGS